MIKRRGKVKDLVVLDKAQLLSLSSHYISVVKLSIIALAHARTIASK